MANWKRFCLESRGSDIWSSESDRPRSQLTFSPQKLTSKNQLYAHSRCEQSIRHKWRNLRSQLSEFWWFYVATRSSSPWMFYKWRARGRLTTTTKIKAGYQVGFVEFTCRWWIFQSSDGTTKSVEVITIFTSRHLSDDNNTKAKWDAWITRFSPEFFCHKHQQKWGDKRYHFAKTPLWYLIVMKAD